ncbi:hypothetical protein GFER_12150 [Geoalkalibacter ferrihydriticus DSM 17813]|uniref:Uncharacterized protein n=1 Tax=Geoalkalibacter ferrihydriticus DSM 17813 TaxID=1121915 RepID=A0A0C2HU42_9BACT|nr:hypothetical protein GFER_12150 [Geoalkalibacter ferrihydriticus DSM 17813]
MRLDEQRQIVLPLALDVVAAAQVETGDKSRHLIGDVADGAVDLAVQFTLAGIAAIVAVGVVKGVDDELAALGGQRRGGTEEQIQNIAALAGLMADAKFFALRWNRARRGTPEIESTNQQEPDDVCDALRQRKTPLQSRNSSV